MFMRTESAPPGTVRMKAVTMGHVSAVTSSQQTAASPPICACRFFTPGRLESAPRIALVMPCSQCAHCIVIDLPVSLSPLRRSMPDMTLASLVM